MIWGKRLRVVKYGGMWFVQRRLLFIFWRNIAYATTFNEAVKIAIKNMK